MTSLRSKIRLDGRARLSIFLVACWLALLAAYGIYEAFSNPDGWLTTKPTEKRIFFYSLGVEGRSFSVDSVFFVAPPGATNEHMQQQAQKARPDLFANRSPTINWQAKSNQPHFYYRWIFDSTKLLKWALGASLFIAFVTYFLIAGIQWVSAGFRLSPTHYGRAGLPYLKEGRLADVLALIQVLALDKDTHRSEDGLETELIAKPASGASWREIAREHSELFRVDPAKKFAVSLVSRHVSEKPLAAEYIERLFETAVSLHDRQLKSSERWTYFTPIWIALIGGVFALLTVAIRWAFRVIDT